MASISQVQVRRIRPGRNDRKDFDDEALAALARSIQSEGLAQPIVVRPVPDDGSGTDLEIVAGERRFRAVRDVLRADVIDAIVHDLDDEAASALMLAENVARENLNPMEEAEAYQRRLDEYGYTVAELADAVGVARKRVTKRLSLLTLRPDIQHLVRTGQMSPGFAQQMAWLDGNRQQLALAVLKNDPRISFREFAAVCDRLRLEQDQESLFDPDDVMQIETFVVESVENGSRRLGRGQLVQLLEAVAPLIPDEEPIKQRVIAVLEQERAARAQQMR